MTIKTFRVNAHKINIRERDHRMLWEGFIILVIGGGLILFGLTLATIGAAMIINYFN